MFCIAKIYLNAKETKQMLLKPQVYNEYTNTLITYNTKNTNLVLQSKCQKNVCLLQKVIKVTELEL